MRSLNRVGYISILCAGVLLVLTSQWLYVGAFLGPVTAPDVIAVATIALAAFQWIRSPKAQRLNKWQRIFLAAALLTWICVGMTTAIRFSYAEAAWLLLGALLVFSLLKPPDFHHTRQATNFLLGGVAALCLITLVSEAAGLTNSWYGDLPGLMQWEKENYWIPVAELLDLDGRWAGPFDHPGRAGIAGAVILVWGFVNRGFSAAFFIAAGLFILVLAGSNTGYLAAASGVVIAAWFQFQVRVTWLPRWLPFLLVLLGFVGLIAILVGPNLTLTGRTTVWPTYLELWRSSPWLGIGDAGIIIAQRADLLPAWAYHAHNSWLDVMARNGLIALMGALVAASGAVLASVKAASRGRPEAFALVTTLLVASITQPALVWLFPAVPMAVFVLAVLLSTPQAPSPQSSSITQTAVEPSGRMSTSDQG